MTALQKLARVYVWHELPGWGRVYTRLVGDWRRDGEWAGEPRRTVRGKLHQYEMELDLSKWSQRATYFLGRFYDLELQLLLSAALRPGDRFVDVGANLGMVSLLAARLVGPAGRVDAFEPNPDCCAAFRATLTRNGIAHVRLTAAALGDAPATLALTVPAGNSGEATLAAGPGAFPDGARTVDVPVLVGDEALADGPPPVLVKIDVEGFERRVLNGLRRTLAAHRPVVYAEVVAEHLARDEATPRDLFELMGALGYECRTPGLTGRLLRGRRLRLSPASPASHSCNVVWVAPGSPAAARLNEVER